MTHLFNEKAYGPDLPTHYEIAQMPPAQQYEWRVRVVAHDNPDVDVQKAFEEYLHDTGQFLTGNFVTDNNSFIGFMEVNGIDPRLTIHAPTMNKLRRQDEDRNANRYARPMQQAA